MRRSHGGGISPEQQNLQPSAFTPTNDFTRMGFAAVATEPMVALNQPLSVLTPTENFTRETSASPAISKFTANAENMARQLDLSLLFK